MTVREQLLVEALYNSTSGQTPLVLPESDGWRPMRLLHLMTAILRNLHLRFGGGWCLNDEPLPAAGCPPATGTWTATAERGLEEDWESIEKRWRERAVECLGESPSALMIVPWTSPQDGVPFHVQRLLGTQVLLSAQPPLIRLPWPAGRGQRVERGGRLSSVADRGYPMRW